ncbi:hypothetical protein ACOME3_001345 [Neoechinorhynchus agilis]
MSRMSGPEIRWITDKTESKMFIGQLNLYIPVIFDGVRDCHHRYGDVAFSASKAIIKAIKFSIDQKLMKCIVEKLRIALLTLEAAAARRAITLLILICESKNLETLKCLLNELRFILQPLVLASNLEDISDYDRYPNRIVIIQGKRATMRVLVNRNHEVTCGTFSFNYRLVRGFGKKRSEIGAVRKESNDYKTEEENEDEGESKGVRGNDDSATTIGLKTSKTSVKNSKGPNELDKKYDENKNGTERENGGRKNPLNISGKSEKANENGTSELKAESENLANKEGSEKIKSNRMQIDDKSEIVAIKNSNKTKMKDRGDKDFDKRGMADKQESDEEPKNGKKISEQNQAGESNEVAGSQEGQKTSVKEIDNFRKIDQQENDDGSNSKNGKYEVTESETDKGKAQNKLLETDKVNISQH